MCRVSEIDHAPHQKERKKTKEERTTYTTYKKKRNYKKEYQEECLSKICSEDLVYEAKELEFQQKCHEEITIFFDLINQFSPSVVSNIISVIDPEFKFIQD